METQQVAQLVIRGAGPCRAQEAEIVVPGAPGIYAIFVDDADLLPLPFGDLLRNRASRLLYLGIASSSLKQRLVDQDLRHKQPSTFFRGLGAVLGFVPPRGSLLGRRNQKNYRFSRADTASIIGWINTHLSIGWLVTDSSLATTEAEAIRAYRPLFNTTHNPERSPELAALRRLCRSAATTRP